MLLLITLASALGAAAAASGTAPAAATAAQVAANTDGELYISSPTKILFQEGGGQVTGLGEAFAAERVARDEGDALNNVKLALNAATSVNELCNVELDAAKAATVDAKKEIDARGTISAAATTHEKGCGDSAATPCKPIYTDGLAAAEYMPDPEAVHFCVYTRSAGPVFYGVAGIYECHYLFSETANVATTPVMLEEMGSDTGRACCPIPPIKRKDVSSTKWSAGLTVLEAGVAIPFTDHTGAPAAKPKIFFEQHGPVLSGFARDDIEFVEDTPGITPGILYEFEVIDPDTAVENLTFTAEEVDIATESGRFTDRKADFSRVTEGIEIREGGEKGQKALFFTFNDTAPADQHFATIRISVSDGVQNWTRTVTFSFYVKELLFKLDTSDSGKRYYDSGFWTNTQNINLAAAADPYKAAVSSNGDIRTAAYMNKKIFHEITIELLVKNKVVATAIYSILPSVSGMTFRDIMNNGNDFIFTDRRTEVTGTAYGTAITAKLGENGNRAPDGDMFMEQSWDHPLIANRFQAFGAQKNTGTRLTTTYDIEKDDKGCHRYAGLGGRHFCNNWGIQFEAAPLCGYCTNRHRYGTNQAKRSGTNTWPYQCGNPTGTNTDYLVFAA